MEMPDYIMHTKQTQEDRDREANNRLWLYQIDQIEQEALCREQDEGKLHDLLKYKMPNNIKVQKKLPDLNTLYHYEV